MAASDGPVAVASASEGLVGVALPELKKLLLGEVINTMSSCSAASGVKNPLEEEMGEDPI